MNKGLIVPNWVLINCPKIPQNLSAQIICPISIVWDFDGKMLHRVSVVRESTFLLHDCTSVHPEGKSLFMPLTNTFLLEIDLLAQILNII